MATRNPNPNDEGAAQGAAESDAEDEGPVQEAGLTYLEGGAVDVSINGADVGDERTTRHAEDANEDVATHDASGRAYTPEEREALRTTRREEKKRRRQAGRDREDRFRSTIETQNRTISELTQRLANVEQRGTVGELQQLQRGIQEAIDAANFFKDQMAAAIKIQDGQAAADFSAKMTQAGQRAEQLRNIQQSYTRQQNQPAPLDPRHQALASRWMADNPWYNPNNTNDSDVRIALTIDDGLFKEGFDPTQPGYWDELTKRMKRYLPHRYSGRPSGGDDRGDDEDEGDGSPPPARREQKPAERRPARTPSAGGGSGDNSGPAGTFRLSRDRVEAMQQAGMWNDPAKRQKMIKRYIEQDRAAARSNR